MKRCWKRLHNEGLGVVLLTRYPGDQSKKNEMSGVFNAYG